MPTATPTILILGRPAYRSVVRVADWLKRFGVHHIVSQTVQLAMDYNASIVKGGKLRIALKEAPHTSYEVEAIWYYRDELRTRQMAEAEESLSRFRFEELKMLCQYLYNPARCARVLGSFEHVRVNKLLVIDAAEAIGLNTPHYLVTNNKAELLRFHAQMQGRVITKPMSENVVMHQNGEVVTSYVQLLNAERLEAIPEHFGYSFFQQAIPEKQDVRVFFFNGQFFSYLIKDSPTLDYKDSYGQLAYEKHALPTAIQAQLKQLMAQLNLMMGAIDFVIDAATNTYYFLEVNPIGMFELMSSLYQGAPDYAIAQYLAYGTTADQSTDCQHPAARTDAFSEKAESAAAAH